MLEGLLQEIQHHVQGLEVLLAARRLVNAAFDHASSPHGDRKGTVFHLRREGHGLARGV